MQEIRIQVIFRTDTLYGTYQDALWFSQTEYDALKQDDLDRMKQERIDNWIKVVTTPSVEPTKEAKLAQVQSEIDMLTTRLQEATEQKAELTKVVK